jgi:hypothetical protein
LTPSRMPLRPDILILYAIAKGTRHIQRMGGALRSLLFQAFVAELDMSGPNNDLTAVMESAKYRVSERRVSRRMEAGSQNSEFAHKKSMSDQNDGRG